MCLKSIVIAALVGTIATTCTCPTPAFAQGRRDTQALASGDSADAQESQAPAATPGTNGKWRVPGTNRPVNDSNGSTPGGLAPVQPQGTLQAQAPLQGGTPGSVPGTIQQPIQPLSAAAARGPIARVTPGSGTLPNDAGQEWRDYDISPYTARVTSTNRPEQAIRDWILRETGYEAWHGDTVALLCGDHRTLHVYHTPQMHTIVQEMVDRFVNTEAESHAFGMRVITVGSPNWRGKAHPMLRPVAAQTPGVQAWLLVKEDAALLVNDLSRRSDFQEHSTPHLVVNNGQSTVVAKTRARNYVRDVLRNTAAFPGFDPQMGQLDEGFKFEFHPLLSLDGNVIDAVLKCDVDQIEKMISVSIPMPTTVSRTQTTKIEVPQLSSSRMHERFRWPVDQVLLISLGVGPAPVPQSPGTLNVPLLSGSSRTELLVFVESRGKLSAQSAAAAAAATTVQPRSAAAKYPGRY